MVNAEKEIKVKQINLDLSKEDPENGKGLKGAYVIENLLSQPVMLVADISTDPIHIFPKFYNEEREALTSVPEPEALLLEHFLGDKTISLNHLFFDPEIISDGDADGIQQ